MKCYIVYDLELIQIKLIGTDELGVRCLEKAMLDLLVHIQHLGPPTT